MDAEYHRRKAKEHYQRYKDKYKTRNATAMANRRQIINDAKATGCSLCPEKELVCLDFHHRDPSQKDFNLADNRTSNVELMLQEIDKCVLVCSNCHRKIHAGIIQLGVS